MEEISQLQINTKYLILTDSLSALQELINPYSSHPIVQRILTIHQALINNNTRIDFIWVPAHSGITGNESVDAAARNATTQQETIYYKIPSKDILTSIKQVISENWQNLWNQQKNKNHLHQIKKSILPWPNYQILRSRREESIITRLRLGHSGLTHSFIFLKLFPPTCQLCSSDAILTVHHLLSECPAAVKEFGGIRIKTLITDPPYIQKVLNFLNRLKLADLR